MSKQLSSLRCFLRANLPALNGWVHVWRSPCSPVGHRTSRSPRSRLTASNCSATARASSLLLRTPCPHRRKCRRRHNLRFRCHRIDRPRNRHRHRRRSRRAHRHCSPRRPPSRRRRKTQKDCETHRRYTSSFRKFHQFGNAADTDGNSVRTDAA